MKFEYRAIGLHGDEKRGEVQAASEGEARALLKSRGLKVKELRRPRKRRAMSSTGVESGPYLSAKQLALFTVQFEVMLAAGVPIGEALAALSRTDDLDLAEMASTLEQQILGGRKLSQSMAILGNTFPALYLQMVRVGEETGRLHLVLRMLGRNLELEADRRRRLVGALVYPIAVLLFSILVVSVLVFYMLPPFLAVFAQTGTQLPGLTVALMTLVTHPLLPWSTLFLVAGAAGLVWGSQRHAECREICQEFLFKVPAIGPLMRRTILTRICENLSLMVATGVHLHHGLVVLRRPTSGSREMDQALERVAEHVSEGDSLSQALEGQPLFPSDLVAFVAVGEESEGVANPLDRWAKMSQERINYRLDTLLTLIEPMLLMGLGVVVAVILLAVFMPMFSMLRAF